MAKQYVFISGAAGGIGKEIVGLLARNGYHIFAGDINEKGLQVLEYENVLPIQLDIASELSIKNVVEIISSKTNYLNGIINIAGTFDQFPLVEASSKAFENLVQINLIGHQNITNALFPLLYQGKGRVINMSSETVLALMPLQSYGFSKKLFDVWNTQLRMELELVGLKTIVIRAGGHQTPFIAKSAEKLSIVDDRSVYFGLMKKIREKALTMLSRKQNDPADLAIVILKALTAKKPKRSYHVNMSPLFRFLSIVPTRIREHIIVQQLKLWI